MQIYINKFDVSKHQITSRVKPSKYICSMHEITVFKFMATCGICCLLGVGWGGGVVTPEVLGECAISGFMCTTYNLKEHTFKPVVVLLVPGLECPSRKKSCNHIFLLIMSHFLLCSGPR